MEVECSDVLTLCEPIVTGLSYNIAYLRSIKHFPTNVTKVRYYNIGSCAAFYLSDIQETALQYTTNHFTYDDYYLNVIKLIIL